MAQYVKKDLTAELHRIFKVLNRPFTRSEFNELASMSSSSVERFFGSWTAALEESGLDDKFLDFKEKERAKFNADDEVDKDWKAKKEDLIRRAESKRVAQIRDQMNKVDLLREVLEETLAKAEPPLVEVHPIKIVKQVSKGNKRYTLWFEVSDLQLGTLMTSESMGGLNKHNWQTWLEKLTVWKKEVIARIKEYALNGTIDDIVFACLGDMVEGQDIFKGQVWQVDKHVADQAIQGANDTAGALIEIMLTFPELKFHILEVFGNHGRPGRKGEAPYSCSWDKIYQRMLELNILKTGVRNVKYHHNEAWFYLIDIYGWNHLLLHGDQGMSALWSNRPTVNGLEKGITRYNQMMQQQVHFLHAGHFHTEWSLSFNMSYILINGSWIGTSNFSASQMVAASPAMQTMHVFEPRVGLAKTERIMLTEGDVRIPIEPHTLNRKKKGAA